MIKTISILLALVFSCSVAFAQDDSGIIFGKNYSFTLTAPKGWVLDNNAGKGQGLQAVFYPQGSSWKTGTAVMYANVYQKTDPSKESLQMVVANDVAEYKKNSADLKVVDAESVLTRTDARSKDKKAIVKYFTGDRNANAEAVAYIDEGKVVVMLVLSTRSQKDFDLSLPAFKDLIGSYFFLGESVVH